MIIFPSITDPYVYLKQLNDDPQYTYRLATYAAATSYLNIGHLQNFNSTKIQAGLSFLKQQAAKERANEMAFFSDKLQQLGKYDGARVQNLINTLNQDPSDINYITFIRELNEVMKGVENTEKRVKSLLDNKSGRKNLNRNALNAADQLLSDLKATRSKVSSNMDELIRGLAFKFFEEKCGEQVSKLFEEKGINTGTRDLTAMAIYLQQSVYSFLVDNPQVLDYVEKTDVQDFEKELERIYPTFVEAFEETNAGQSLMNGGHQLDIALKEISEFFDIAVLNKAAKKANTKKGLNESTVQKLLSHTGINAKKMRVMLRRVKIKTQFQAQKLGNFKELNFTN